VFAVLIGLTTALVWGLAANRQYSANFGLTYTYDPVPRVKTEVKEVEKVAKKQVKQRLLLEEDAERIIAEAKASDVPQ